MSVRNAVVGVVYKKDENDIKFLILHRIWGWEGWEFAKGGVEKTDPTDENALLREIKEETGLENVRVQTKLPFEIKYKYPKKYSSKFKHSETLQKVFLVRSFGDVKIPETKVREHDDFIWLPYNEARGKLTHLNHKKALDAAWEYMKNTPENPKA